jgi:hypothetical protein
MIRRCENPKSSYYRDYGGRGIQVCDRWRASVLAFIDDMGKCPDGMELDRVDNDGNYEPGNCRWATRLTQVRNRRNTRHLTVHGVTRPMAEWAEQSGIPYDTIKRRLIYGWSDERAVLEPLRGNA